MELKLVHKTKKLTQDDKSHRKLYKDLIKVIKGLKIEVLRL